MPRGISRYDEAAFQGRLWTPERSGVGIAAWFDASDLSTITYGASGISQWRDKSGNVRHFNQSVDGNRPILTSIGLNNQSTIYQDGTDDFFNASYTYTGTEITVFLVSRITSGGGTNARALSFANGTTADWSSNDTFFIGYQGGNNIRFFRNATIVAASTITTRGTNAFAVHAITKTGGTATVSSNGEVPVSGTTSTAGFNLTYIQTGSGGDYSQGDFAEVIVIPSFVTETQRDVFVGYLAWKWGLVDILRASHPFISRPPTIGD